MRFLLTSVGTYGDVGPFVTIAASLSGRGHEVILALNPVFVPLAERLGLKTYPIEKWRDGLEFTRHARFMIGPLASAQGLRKFYIPAMGKRYEELGKLMRSWRPDLVCGHAMCLDAFWAASDLEIPWSSGLPSPLGVLSAEELSHIPGLLNLQRAPLWLRKYGRWRLRQLGRWIFDPPVNRARRRVGLSKQRGVFMERIHDGRVTLGLWSPFFRPPASDDPKNLCICGFPWFEWGAQSDDHQELLRFLDEGDPPVVVLLGTGQFMVVGNFFEVAARVCKRLGRRGLFLTGSENRDLVPDCPPSVKCFPQAPLSLVLPRASVVVHHGGIGGAAHVMRAGCPSVVVPFAHDQPDNALRIRRLGLGERLSRHRLTETALAKVLERMFNDDGMRARCIVMREKLQSEDGAAEAAKILEQAAGGH